MKTAWLALLMPLTLTACGGGPDHIIKDLPSPGGDYHVEVRKCPQAGSLTWSEMTQVSVLKAADSERCHSSLNSLAQFHSVSPDEDLQLEWLRNSQLRAWHPSFNPEFGPMSANYAPGMPITLIYRPAN